MLITHEQVRFIGSNWYENDFEPGDFNDNYWENFTIIEKGGKKIDLLATLNSMSGTTLLKIAIDLGVDTLISSAQFPQSKTKLSIL